MSLRGPVRLSMLLLILIAAVQGAVLVAGESSPGPAAGVPELKVLEKMIGVWDEVVELPDGKTMTAEGTTRWALGGTHIQSEFVIELPGGSKLAHLVLMTWDKGAQEYRSWMFSTGADRPLESTATWDEPSQTLTSTSVPDGRGVVTTSTSRFVEDGRIEWTVESKDQDGKVVFSLQGTDTRRKD